jgi:hypothetical protein
MSDLPYPKELDAVCSLKGNVVRVILFKDEERHSVHWFRVAEFKEDGFYVTAISFDAFRHREAKKLYEDGVKQNLTKKRTIRPWRALSNHIFENDLVFEMEHKLKIHDDLKQHFHASLWDFYKAVGYDYKKQKWMGPLQAEESL